MNTVKKWIVVSLLISCFLSLPVLALDKTAAEQKASACAACHGSEGKSNNGQFPNLAAQQAAYLVSQLKAFKSASRHNTIMEPMAASLDDSDINNLAAYFSNLPAVKAGGDATLAKLGQTKATMCLGCHGTTAAGNGQFPRLAGQQSDYILKQLNDFKDGARKNAQMQAIAATLSSDDMKALAAYFASL